MHKYSEIKTIGRGNYGTAVLVRDVSNGSKYVVKKIPMIALSEKEKRDAVTECKILSTLHHPNVVEYIDSFLEDNTLHLVTQYCELGDLARLIKKKKRKTENRYFSEDQILDWFIQIAMAVDYIHSKNIMHRDLKTANVFLMRTNVVKLGDFGIAKVLDSTLEQAHTVVGTPYYMSPEVCENKQYDKKSDMWAIGCILYELCTLNHAFDASNLLGLVFKIVQETYPPIPEHYSEEMANLIQLLLSKNPAVRPSCRKIFRMPFIKKRLEELATADDLGETPLEGPNSARSIDSTGGSYRESNRTSARSDTEAVARAARSARLLSSTNSSVSTQLHQTRRYSSEPRHDDLTPLEIDVMEMSIPPPPSSNSSFDPLSPPPPPPPLLPGETAQFNPSQSFWGNSPQNKTSSGSGDAPQIPRLNFQTLRQPASNEQVNTTIRLKERPVQSARKYHPKKDASYMSKSMFKNTGGSHRGRDSQEEDQYSDDFESDNSNGRDDARLTVKLKTPLPWQKTTDEIDAENVLKECKRISNGTSHTMSKHESSVSAKDLRSSGRYHAGPDWHGIVEHQREELKDILGGPVFLQVYRYLKEVHAQGNRWETASLKEQQRTLQAIVGSKELLPICFDIDQLIYMEETYLNKI